MMKDLDQQVPLISKIEWMGRNKPTNKEDYKIYRPRRDKYMKEHPNCEVDGCNKPSQDLHHKNGRTNERLYDTNYFMAICRSCHTRIDEDPIWARENGYLIWFSFSFIISPLCFIIQSYRLYQI